MLISGLAVAAWLATISSLTVAVQEPRCSAIVLASSAVYCAAYRLCMATGWLQPPAGTMSEEDRAEWVDRILSQANAFLLVVGSACCFSEWPYYAGREAYVAEPVMASWSHPCSFASLMLGYFHFDLGWIMSSPSRLKAYKAHIVHHLVFIFVGQYVLFGWYFKKPFAWLSAAELSTLPLNIRWFLAVRGDKGRLYDLSSLVFALSFLVTRVLGYGLGLVDLWLAYPLWVSADWGLYAVIGGLHVGYALNLFWSHAVVSKLVAFAKPKKEKEG